MQQLRKRMRLLILCFFRIRFICVQPERFKQPVYRVYAVFVRYQSAPACIFRQLPYRFTNHFSFLRLPFAASLLHPASILL